MLYELCADFIAPEGELDPELDRKITGICLDSRELKAGDCFLALTGEQHDGRSHISQAVEQGASAILYEASLGFPKEAHVSTADGQIVPSFGVDHLWQKVGLIAQRFYHDPANKMPVIGITGTNGKTSCCQFIARVLNNLGTPAGMMGTLGWGMPDKLQHCARTTPTAIEVHQRLDSMLKNGAKAVAMEVSSHGLVQARVQGVHFHTAVFTNLSRDHLDYHGDMESYGQAKSLLFRQPGLRHALINADDEFGKRLLLDISPSIETISFSLEKQQVPGIPAIITKHLSLSTSGMSAKIQTPWGNGELKTKLLGKFNLANLYVVLGTLCLLDYPLESVLTAISQLQGVLGRMECFGGGNKPLVVVDYAHTPDALENVLHTLRAHCEGELYCVFGCGGDRDKGKRPLMGKLAASLSDHAIITNDNPRTESPESIADEIVKGINQDQDNVRRILDRHDAIAYAIAQSGPGDIVLVAGKGHEQTQILGERTVHFSDQSEVIQALGR